MKIVFEIIVIVVLWIAVAGCSGRQGPDSNSQGFSSDALTSKTHQYQYTQLHLGVQVRIVVFAEKEEKAVTAAKAAFARIAALEDIFSNYREHSELTRLTTTSYGKPIKVSNELFEVLQVSYLFSRETGGAFDITLGTLIDLWKSARFTQTRPPADAIERAIAHSGWTQMVLNDVDKTVLLQAPEMKLDVGGIAKGYILDEAIQVLSQAGISQAMIEAGGEIVVSNAPPGKAGWNIEIPDAPPGSAIEQLASTLKNAAISTSGDTEQFVVIDGVRYSHVMDPHTGFGSSDRIMATVIAPDGMTADRFATALTVMRSAAADSLLKAHTEVTAFVRRVEG